MQLARFEELIEAHTSAKVVVPPPPPVIDWHFPTQNSLDDYILVLIMLFKLLTVAERSLTICLGLLGRWWITF